MAFHLNLKTETVEQARPEEPLCVTPDIPIREVMKIMKQRNTGSALVCKDNRPVGIFTERDALRLMATDSDLNVPIESVATTEPATLETDDTVATAIQKMTAGGYRRMPIVGQDGTTEGMLKVSHIVHYLVDHFPSAIYNLPPQPRPVTQHREGA